MRTCEVDGCERPFAYNGMCAAHNMRIRRTGNARAHVPIGEGNRGSRTAATQRGPFDPDDTGEL